jgi:hypothetical protein
MSASSRLASTAGLNYMLASNQNAAPRAWQSVHASCRKML